MALTLAALQPAGYAGAQELPGAAPETAGTQEAADAAQETAGAQEAAGTALETEAEDAQREVIHIKTAKDLEELAANCVLDSWSENVQVILDGDIDLMGSSFTSIPCFSGLFDGQGHTIKGVSVTRSCSHAGLFRYLTKDALVRDLSVDGRLMPGTDSSCIGGIAGRNEGMISGCSFTGSISAQESAGGIAGENAETGIITDCSFSGTIIGAHTVGGIAGKNEGKILSSRNEGEVNTVPDVPIEKKDVSLTGDLVSTLENYDIASLGNDDFVSVMDVGGIAGTSQGLIDNCVNAGTVGYPHIGYNIGGIVGRTKGYVSCSTNEGEVFGRKDTGGIAGQIEPKTVWEYSSGKLDDLLSELKDLDSLLNTMISDASLGIGTARDHITDAEQRTAEAVSALEELIGKTSDELVTDAGSIRDLITLLSDAVRDEDASAIADCLSQLYTLLNETDLTSSGLNIRVNGNMKADTASALAAGSTGLQGTLANLSAQISEAARGSRTAGENRIAGENLAAGENQTTGAAASATQTDPAAETPDYTVGNDGEVIFGDAQGSSTGDTFETGGSSSNDIFEADNSGSGDIFEAGSSTADDTIEAFDSTSADTFEADAENGELLEGDAYDTVILEMPQADEAPQEAELQTGVIGDAAGAGDITGQETAPGTETGSGQANAADAGDNAGQESAADAGDSAGQESAADAGNSAGQESGAETQDSPSSAQTYLPQSGSVDLSVSGSTDSNLDGNLNVQAELADPASVDQIISLMEQILGHSASLLDTDTLAMAKDILGKLSFNSPDVQPFYKSFETMLASLQPLDDDIAGTASTFSADFTAVMNQADVIYDTLFEYIENFSLTRSDDEITEPLTDPWQSNEGAVSGCVNRGTVNADMNAGGIVGAVEYEDLIDAEDMVDISQYVLKDARKMIFAAVRSCENKGDVSAKKSAAGGITGSQKFGVITGCISSGKIEVAEGELCGGIAGTAQGEITLCQSQNLLSGKTHVGGIAGKAENLRSCISFSQISASGEYIGAVAGEAAGTMENNYYLDRGLGGVDSVSFHGATDPFSAEDIPAVMATVAVDGDAEAEVEADAQNDTQDAAPDTSAEMQSGQNTAADTQSGQDPSVDPGQQGSIPHDTLSSQPTVTFMAGDEIIKQVQVPFGGSIDELPEVENDGEDYWVWDEFDQSAIFSDITVNGSYHHPIRTLSAGGNPPQFLAEGTFYEGMEFTAEPYVTGTEEADTEGQDVQDQNADGKETGGSGTEAYTVSVSGYDGPLTIRMKAKNGGKLKEQKEDGSKEEIAYTTDGSYLVFPMTNGGILIYEPPADRLQLHAKRPNYVYAAGGAAAAALAAVIAVFHRKKRKR